MSLNKNHKCAIYNNKQFEPRIKEKNLVAHWCVSAAMSSSGAVLESRIKLIRKQINQLKHASLATDYLGSKNIQHYTVNQTIKHIMSHWETGQNRQSWVQGRKEVKQVPSKAIFNTQINSKFQFSFFFEQTSCGSLQNRKNFEISKRNEPCALHQNLSHFHSSQFWL